MGFKKAERTQARLRMGLCGPSGSGKTYTALRIATGLCAPGKRVALVDSERGSSSLYAGKFDFDVQELENFKVETYLKALREAEAAGYGVVVLDSISHAWAGKGGLLEQVDDATQREKGNKWAAWRHITPQHHEFVEAMLTSPCHIIATMRTKTEWVLESNEKGKQVPRKVGLAPVQRDGMEYEFTVVGDLDEGVLSVSKSRIDDVLPLRAVVRLPGEDLGKRLAAWCADGAAPPPVATATPDGLACFRAVRDAAVAAGWAPERIAGWVKARGRTTRESVTSEDVEAMKAELAVAAMAQPQPKATQPVDGGNAQNPLYLNALNLTREAGLFVKTLQDWCAGNGIKTFTAEHLASWTARVAELTAQEPGAQG